MTPSVQGFNPIWLWGMLRRRKWAMLAAFLSAMAISLGTYLAAPRMYESSFEIQMLSESFPPELQRLLGPFMSEKMQHLGTEMGVLESYEVIGGALRRAALATEATPAGELVEKIREVKKNIVVAKVESANILTVSVKSARPEAAFGLARSILEEYEAHSRFKESKADAETRSRYEEILGATRKEIARIELSLEKLRALKRTEDEAEKSRVEAEGYEKQIRDELKRLSDERDSLLAEYTPEWPAVQEIELDIDGIESVLECAGTQELCEIRDRELKVWVELRQKAMRARARCDEMVAEAEKVREELEENEKGKQALGYFESQLSSKVEIERTLMKAISDTDIKIGKHSARFAVLKRPHPPQIPISPHFPTHAMLGFLMGLALAVSATYLLEAIDPALRTPEQVQMYTRLEVLGSLPPLSPTMRLAEGLHDAPRLVFSRDNPDPVSADSYRMLKTAVQAFVGEGRGLTLLSTSAEPREGKSTVALNLAAAFAEAGQKTVVVDCNLRHPGLSRITGEDHHPGVAEVVEKGVSWQEVEKPCALERLTIVPAGSPSNTSSVVLESEKFGALLSELRADHDVVILDSPPALLLTDALILCSRVQGAIIVYSAGQTNKLSLFRTIATLQKAKATFLAVVLNHKQPAAVGGKGYYYYYGEKRKS